MSYGINISFHKAENKLEAFELAQSAMKTIAENALDYLEGSMFYCPLTQMKKKEDSYDSWLYSHYENAVRQSSRMWVRNLFNFRFMWWPELKLLGVISDSKYLQPMGWKDVYFQNGTDQNYPYSDWEGICETFDEYIIKSQNIPDEKIIQNMSATSREDYNTPERLAQYCDYQRKWAMYKSVFETLDIDSILYGNGKSDKYEYFAMNAIPDNDTYLHLEIAARAFAQKFPNL